MNRADVRVIQGGGGSGFAPETIQGIRVAGEFVGQKLESDKALEPGVLRLVDDAHPAAAQFSDNAVMGGGHADREIAAFMRVFTPQATDCPRGHFYRRALQETSRLLLRGQQRPDFPLQCLVTRARLLQKLHAVARRTLQRGLQQVIDAFPLFRIHRLSRRSIRDRARPWRCSNRASR